MVVLRPNPFVPKVYLNSGGSRTVIIYVNQSKNLKVLLTEKGNIPVDVNICDAVSIIDIPIGNAEIICNRILQHLRVREGKP